MYSSAVCNFCWCSFARARSSFCWACSSIVASCNAFSAAGGGSLSIASASSASRIASRFSFLRMFCLLASARMRSLRVSTFKFSFCCCASCLSFSFLASSACCAATASFCFTVSFLIRSCSRASAAASSEILGVIFASLLRASAANLRSSSIASFTWAEIASASFFTLTGIHSSSALSCPVFFRSFARQSGSRFFTSVNGRGSIFIR